MKTKTILTALLIACGLSPAAHAQINFEGLPTVRTADEGLQLADARRERVIKTFLNLPLAPPPTPPQELYQRFAQTMIARMIYRQDLAAVSANLLTPSFQPWGVGTNIAVLGSVCKRLGDYDFVLQSLVHMAYIDDEAGRTILTEPARRKLRDVLLSESGLLHHIKFTLKNCIPVKITDSENHILMSEIARYLKNQLVFEDSKRAGQDNPGFDNARNGFDDWMLQHLSQFLRNDFNEVNSRPYQGYTLVALANLYSHARSPRVKTMAQMVIDYLAAKTAAQSSGLRRNPPFRRQKARRDLSNLVDYDNTVYFFSVDSGAYRYLSLTPGNEQKMSFSGDDYIMFMSAVDRYEIPKLIVDLMVERKSPDFTRMRHRDVEVYASSSNFLISAGGRHRSQFGFFTGESDEWGVPTFIIPTNYGMEKRDLFHIDGDANWNKKNNLCVAPGFACGQNLYVPANIDKSCIVTRGAWTFYDLEKCQTPHMGFYVAALRSDAKQKMQLGMLEVSEPTMPFDRFVESIARNNGSLALVPGQIVTYKKSDGHSVTFRPDPGPMDSSPIVALDGVKQETDTKKWPLASGSILKAKGDGLIVIENPSLKQRLILDDRNPLNPIRRLESM